MSFDFAIVIADTKNALLNPAGYFRTMRSEGGLAEPVLKALLYGVVSVLLTWLWYMLGIFPPGPQDNALSTTMLLLLPAGYVVGLFIGAVLLMIVSALSGGITRFETCLRATAAIMAIQPISAALGVLYVSTFLGLLASLAISLYGLKLLWNAMLATLHCSRRGTQITCIVLAAFSILGAVAALIK